MADSTMEEDRYLCFQSVIKHCYKNNFFEFFLCPPSCMFLLGEKGFFAGTNIEQLLQ